MLPALPFFVKRRPRLLDFLVPTLALAGLLGVSNHWSQLHLTPTYSAVLHPGNATYKPATNATPNFRAELDWEENMNFGSPAARLVFAEKCVSISVFGLAIVIALFHILRFEIFARVVQVMTVVLLGSAPLWYFAHDWGRFLAYTAFLAVVSSSAAGLDSTAADQVSPSFLQVAAILRNLGGKEILGFGFLFVLVTSPSGYNHYGGTDFLVTRDFGLIVVVAIVARLFGARIQPSSPSQ